MCSETQPAAVLKAVAVCSSWAGYQFKLCLGLNGITWRGPAGLLVGHCFSWKHAGGGRDDIETFSSSSVQRPTR